MNCYRYHAVDSAGQQCDGQLQAESLEAATEELAAQGFYLLGMSQQHALFTQWQEFFQKRSVKRIEIIDLANNLSVMIRAGLPLISSLGDLAESIDNKVLSRAVADIKKRVGQGSTFSGAVAMHRDIFPDIFIRLVTVGEETGRFERSLADVASHLTRIEDLAASIKRALIYPAFALTATLGALLFWMVGVLPKIIAMIKDMGGELPLITQILFSISGFLQKFWYLLPIFPVLLFVLVVLAKKNSNTALGIDHIKLKLPVYKLIEYNRLLALFAEQMRILIVAGLTIDKTLTIVTEVINNKVFQKALDEIHQEITLGSTIAEALKKQTPLFPPLVLRMVSVGETSGTLDEQFAFLAEHYLKKLDDISAKLGKIIEPLVIGGVGLLFALILAGLMLPVYNLVSSFGKS